MMEYEHINTGAMSGIDITEFVDLRDRTIWVSYEVYRTGYGASFTQKFNPDGTPALYDGDVNELIEDRTTVK